MKDCCRVRGDYTARQVRVLRVVLWINVAMFLLELTTGLIAHSTALFADSIDMLGDAIVYAFSLHVVAREPVWQARSALLKGVIMAVFGAGVLAEVAIKIIGGVVPAAATIGVIGVLALVANLVCLALLWPRRADDVNMRSAWTCSLNDVAGNVGILVAGAGVAVTGRAWPDVVVGLLIAAVFVASSVGVIREAWRHLRPLAVGGPVDPRGDDRTARRSDHIVVPKTASRGKT
jgi:Co/Zn/Cd efflux system component